MDAVKKVLFKGMTIIIIAIALILNSCQMDGGDKKEFNPKTDNSGNGLFKTEFKNDIFYFNRYNVFTRVIDGDVTFENSIILHESGSIEIYGNVIRVKKTATQDQYFIDSEEYDEDKQIYTFNTKDAIIKFDVTQRELEVKFLNSDEGEVYYINSTIKSNW